MSNDLKQTRTVEAAFPQVEDRRESMRLGWRILLTLLLLVLLAILGLLAATNARVSAAPAPALQDNSQPLVFAFYYTWFDEQTWSYDQLSDLPSQPYVSRDRAAMGRHIDQAKAAGIDAFFVAWYGPDGEFNQTESNLAALLDEAAARNFKIGILFESDSPFFAGVGSLTGALQHATYTHLQHPAYLGVDGRPVVFFWRPTIYGVESWHSIRQQVDPGYGSIWISEGVDTSYLSVFDGHHLYSNTWNPPADLTYINQKFANGVAQYGAAKFWVATVMPGYNDTRIRADGFARDRQGGAYYEQSWQAAIASQPNWIVITSFNEWPEGTYVEPSAAYGDHYLDLTTRWSQQFKSSHSPASVPAAVIERETQPATADPTAYVEVSLLNVRSGPGLDYEVITMVSYGDALPILEQSEGTSEWLPVAVDDRRGWVFAPLVRVEGIE